MELYQHKPIFYSLGNFIFDQHYGPTTEAVLANVTIAGKKICQIEMTPVFINECVPERADEKTAAKIRTDLIKYSEPFGLTESTFKNWELTNF
jgi:poly-gamma-glutamate capsule biosynthesis protein CapA/YwtB (metallophosphatase superfamily)